MTACFNMVMAVVIRIILFQAPATEVKAASLFVFPLFSSTMLHSEATIEVDYTQVAVGAVQSQDVLIG